MADNPASSQEVQGLIHIPQAGYFNWHFSFSSSVPPGKCLDITTHLALTVRSHILSYLLLESPFLLTLYNPHS